MDPLSISLAALAIAKLCLSAVRGIKRVIEAMKRTRQSLLNLLQAAERTRLYLEALRGLTAQLHDPSQRALSFAFNESGCRQTVSDLHKLVRKIADRSAASELWRQLNWVYYKSEAEAMTRRLQEQETQISSLLVLITAQSSVKTERRVEELNERIRSQSEIVDAFDTITLVDDREEAINNTLAKPSHFSVWHGSPLRVEHSREYLQQRDELSNAAYWGQWEQLWQVLRKGDRKFGENWINCFRLKPVEEAGTLSLWTPLHQAAFMCAPIEVVEEMLRFGALRTLRTRWSDANFTYRNLTAVEIARDLGYYHLYQVLSPVILHPIPPAELLALQETFHNIIREDLDGHEYIPFLNLPDLTALTELASPEMWFPLPFLDKDSGYLYRLDDRDLVVKSYSIAAPGAMQVYRVTQNSVVGINQAVIFNAR